MNFTQKAEILVLKAFGDSERGFLTALQNQGFDIKRTYWTYDIPNGVSRGFHAHKECVQILFCLKGKLEILTELPNGEMETYLLSKPNEGLILWPHIWHEVKYFENAIQLVVASHEYDENDYLRSKSDFKEYYAKK